jgi:hypothetical protein
MAELAYEQQLAEADELTQEVLELRGPEHSVRVVKARVILGGYLRAKGLSEPLERLVGSLAQVERAVLRQAREDIAATTERAFWEITDRGLNFDFVEEERRQHVLALIDEQLAKS